MPALPDPGHIPRTGDDSPARGLWRYVWRMSAWRQAGLVALALLSAALNLAPVELQRRIVDDAITPADASALTLLALLYGAAILAHQAVKLAFRLFQGWVAETAVLYTRRHLASLYAEGRAGEAGRSGEAVSIIGTEVDKLGGFVGHGPSDAAADAAMLLGVLGYMLVVEPVIAGLAIVMLLPQVLLAPVMQRRLNHLIERRLSLMRDLGSEIGELSAGGSGTEATSLAGPLRSIYRNRMWLTLWKQAMKGMLNLLNAAAPLMLLGIGGAMVIAGETTVGVLVAFLSALQRVADPIRNLISFYRQCAQAGVQHAMIARWM